MNVFGRRRYLCGHRVPPKGGLGRTLGSAPPSGLDLVASRLGTSGVKTGIWQKSADVGRTNVLGPLEGAFGGEIQEGLFKGPDRDPEVSFCMDGG